MQDVPLARALYRHCQVGQEIPRELWAAVAQVLAFVLSRRHAGQYGGEHRTPRRADELPEVVAGSRRRRAVATDHIG
ncbi:flhB: flagellar biosynthetic protein FlhB [compost metagenome]